MGFSVVKKLLPICVMGLCVMGLWSCSESAPPPGFDAVRPGHGDSSWNGCPELSGSFDLLAATAQNELISDWLGHQNPAMETLVFEEVIGSNAYNYHVQMNMTDFLAQADQLREKKPADYYDWRKLTLALKNNDALATKTEQIKSIQKLGPLLQINGQTRSYTCKAGWMKVLEKERSVEGEEGRYTRQWDLWIGRDVDGNLLLQTIRYRQKPGWTFWAAGGAGVRLIPEHYAWHKVAKTTQNIETLILREQDLLPVAPPNRSPDCIRDLNYLVEYNQDLLQHLPEGVYLTKFLPIQGTPIDPCDRQLLQVGFTGGERGASAAVLRYLKEDVRVKNLALKETQVDSHRQMHFLVEYTLILN